MRHDIVDEPIHNPEFFGEPFAGNLHGDVTDAIFAVSLYVADDVLHGRRGGILIRRRKVKAQTSRWPKRCNRQRRESYNTATSP